MYVIGNVFPTSAPPTMIMGPQPPVAVMRGPGLGGVQSAISLFVVMGALIAGLTIVEKGMKIKQRREERRGR